MYKRQPMILDDENLLFSLLYFYVGDIAERKDGKDWATHLIQKNNTPYNRMQ